MSLTPPSWKARHFAGGAAHPREAIVHLEADGLVVATEEGLRRRWPFESVVVVRGGRGEPVQIELRGEATEALILPDPRFLEALRAAAGARRLRRLGGTPASAPMLVALAVSGGLLLFAAWRWGVPALAVLAADRVPPAWEREFGAVVVDAMAPPGERIADPRVVTPVRDVLALLASAGGARPDSFQVIVARSQSVNAFAAPGGTIVVTSGLLLALHGPDELAAVLAHEMTHVRERHPVRGLFARLGVRALLTLVAGDPSGLPSVLDAAGTLGELSYSRRDERVADEGAARLLARAGVRLTALADALERIAGAGGRAGGVTPDFLSTHPSTAGRLERARALAARLRVERAAPLPAREIWRSMRDALGEIPGEP